MEWEIEYTNEFEIWWNSLSIGEQEEINVSVEILRAHGPALGRPQVETIRTSRYPNMKELRIQHEGRPYRVLFIFDPRRTGMLLIGGDKTGNDRWYEEFVPQADGIYDQHLKEIGQKK